MSTGLNGQKLPSEDNEDVHERNEIQYLWFSLMMNSGLLKEDANGFEAYGEYGKLFEKLFEKKEFRTDFDYRQLATKAFTHIQTFNAEARFFYQHVKKEFMRYLIERGIIADEEEFLNGNLDILFNISVGCSLDELKAFEKPDLNGSTSIDFMAGDGVVLDVREEILDQNGIDKI